MAKHGFGAASVLLLGTWLLGACSPGSGLAAQRPGLEPMVGTQALGPGLTRVRVDAEALRWRPDGLPSAAGWPLAPRRLLASGFAETELIQKLRLRASWWGGDALPEVQATESVVAYTGSLPATLELVVPAGHNRLFELLGQREVADGSATRTVNIAQSYSLAAAPSGSQLSIAFNPDRMAAGRTLKVLLDRAASGSTSARSLLTQQDITSGLVSLVNGKTGYSSSTNSYQRVNPLAFRSEALATRLIEDGLPLLNGTTALGDAFGTEGWAKLRVKADLGSEGSDLPQGSDVLVDLFDLSTSLGQKADALGQCAFDKVAPGTHALRLRGLNGEHWTSVTLAEGEASNPVRLNGFTAHPLSSEVVVVKSTQELSLVGALPNQSSELPGLVYHSKASADATGNAMWVGLGQSAPGGALGGGLLRGNTYPALGLSGLSTGGYRLAYVNSSDQNFVDWGSFTGSSATGGGISVGSAPSQLTLYTNTTAANDACYFLLGDRLLQRGRSGSNTGGNSGDVAASGAGPFAVDGIEGSTRVLWEGTAGGRLRTRRMAFSGSGGFGVRSEPSEVGGPAGPQSAPAYLVFGSTGVLAFEQRTEAGGTPRVVLMTVNPTADGWSTHATALFTSGAQRKPRLSLLKGPQLHRLAMSYEEDGGPTGQRLRFGILNLPASPTVDNPNPDFSWAFGPITVAEPATAGCQAMAFQVPNTERVLHLWRHNSGEIRSRMQYLLSTANP